MADKGTLEAIEKLKRRRALTLVDTIDGVVATMQNFSTTKYALALGFRFLVDDFREQANLVMESGARGKGAEATALRAVASQLSLLADAVEKVDLDADDVEPSPARGGPKLPAEWCRKTDEHGPHLYELPMPEGGNPLDRGPLRRECTGHHPRDLSGLNALINDRHAGVVGNVRVVEIPAGDGLQTVKLDPPFVGPGTVLATFGAPGTMLHATDLQEVTFAAPAHTMTVERVPMPDYLLQPNPELEGYLRGDDVAPVEIRNRVRDGWESTPPPDRVDPIAMITEWQPYRINTPELKEAAAAMFAAPTPPSKPAEPEMPGRRLSWAELLAPPPLAPPEHMSYSQVGGMSCGTQYRLTRLEPGVVERPRWANVGGSGLHLAVEWFEKQIAKAPGNAEYARSRIEIAGGMQAIWTYHFGQAITEQCLRTPSVPPGQWKESGRHVKEGYTWWLTQGEDMLRRYLDGRLVEIEANSRVIMGANGADLMIEHEGMLDVEGVPTKVVLDQVWRVATDDGVLMIEDVKSGGWAPDGTFQLGLYAWYLRRTLGWEGQILGRYWDARKGEHGPAIDLIETHPWEEIQLRVLPEAAKKKALLFSPNPSFGGCKSCMVSHACPAVKATS